ncbi:RNA methyltransferase, RsmE family [Alteromonadaceae bacterium Bs31]|nr:RNA methyltransferase, RsmE family [Alteromonadaceae bacterium Bs31]
MNLLLLKQHQFFSESSALLNKDQQQHIEKVLKLSSGDWLRVGLVDGNMGRAMVKLEGNSAIVEIEHLQTPPPPQLPLTLILALPRPQMIKRILQTVACMGVEHLCLIQSSRVEKSFWQSPALTDSAVEQQLLLGLEQGVATQLPKISKFQRFRPFVEDCLNEIIKGKKSFIAHPGELPPCPSLETTQKGVMVIGPEGGFLEKEVSAFQGQGAEVVQMGSRILKVETAVTAMITKLYSLP